MNRIFLGLILLVLGMGNPIEASTFIGNGGSVLDSELRSAIGRLKIAVKAVGDDERICECAGDSSQCALLKDLDKEEVEYCAQFVEDMKSDLIVILNDHNVKFRWASKVQGQERTFDGAASASSKTIVLDEKRFASIGTADRVQLLAHEMLHLLKYKGQALVDEGARGAFRGDEGGRRLLDSAGAALVIVGMRAQAIPLQTSSLSRPFKNFYLEYSSGSRYLDSAYRKSALQDATVNTTSLELTWYPRHSDNIGYSLGYYGEANSYDRYPELSLVSEHRLEAMTLGVSYRFLPFELGITWFDSIQLSSSARVGYGRVSESFKDEFNKLSERSAIPLVEGRVNAQLPLYWNFWLTLSQGLVYTPYEITNLKVKSKSINSNNSVGVSYGISL